MQTFAEFWPFYLREHSRLTTRRLHFAGTSISILAALSALALRNPWLGVFAFVQGYAWAWVGHFFVEHNKPATFKYPLWSFASDFKMLGCFLRGTLPEELARAGVKED